MHTYKIYYQLNAQDVEDENERCATIEAESQDEAISILKDEWGDDITITDVGVIETAKTA